MRKSIFMLSLFILLCYCLSAVVHVPGDQPTIQEGINAASDTDEIVVANGTFSGLNNTNLTFLEKDIIVRSENGPDYTTIDCENLYQAASFGLNDSNVIFEGFTIINGSSGGGGAIYMNSNSATINNCKFSDNYTSGDGGAIKIYNYHNGNADPIISNCTFLNNTSAGDGGAIEMMWGFGKIQRCTFTGNSGYYGGAIYTSASAVEITNSVFNLQTALSGGGCDFTWNSNGATVQNSIFYHNTTNYNGSAILIQDSDVELYNLTVCDNTSNGGGQNTACAIMYSGSITSSITRNIIGWDNTPRTLAVWYATVNIDYSDIEGGASWIGGGYGSVTWGGDNLDTNPMFVPRSDVYHLDDNSPCIDTGDVDSEFNDPEDPADSGNALYPALGGLRCDMGAYGGPWADEWNEEEEIVLDPPENIEIYKSSETIYIEWDSVTGASSYIVYSDTDPNGSFSTIKYDGILNSCSLPITEEKEFYKVTASN